MLDRLTGIIAGLARFLMFIVLTLASGWWLGRLVGGFFVGNALVGRSGAWQ